MRATHGAPRRRDALERRLHESASDPFALALRHHPDGSEQEDRLAARLDAASADEDVTHDGAVVLGHER